MSGIVHYQVAWTTPACADRGKLWALTTDPEGVTCPRCVRILDAAPVPADDEPVTAGTIITMARSVLSLVEHVPEGDPSRAMAELIRDAVEALVGDDDGATRRVRLLVETSNNAVNPQEAT